MVRSYRYLRIGRRQGEPGKGTIVPVIESLKACSRKRRRESRLRRERAVAGVSIGRCSLRFLRCLRRWPGPSYYLLRLSRRLRRSRKRPDDDARRTFQLHPFAEPHCSSWLRSLCEPGRGPQQREEGRHRKKREAPYSRAQQLCVRWPFAPFHLSPTRGVHE